VEVLAMADCAITHGGFGSVIECIVNEVPMIVYSPSLTDQDGNASRVVFHGVGVRAEWDIGHPDALEQHIDRVLSDGSFGANVRNMNRVFDKYVEEQAAVRTIEQFLAEAGEP
jgi:UDP:flavonoid glycosyltransferase YjiC (YdhE family)